MTKPRLQRVLVTGGLGFIGTNFVRMILAEGIECIGNIDKVTYASNTDAKVQFESDRRYRFFEVDLTDTQATRKAVLDFEPDVVVHFAAESHVDRSIESSAAFIQTNIVGTFNLLEACREYSDGKQADQSNNLRFIHVSTDEVYGSLGSSGLFYETSQYQPNSPYSASKAASDHLARAWHHTYGLPVIVTNCSNNFGPYQNAEKLIPTVISCCLENKLIPIYGTGENVRDWIYVDDHNRAIFAAIAHGVPGESYNIGGNNEIKNIDLVNSICLLMDEMRPKKSGSYLDLITFVEDRKGHDYRYAIDSSKAKQALHWECEVPFQAGLRNTLRWYIARSRDGMNG